MKLNDIKHAHFIGIGGAGMSGVAKMFVKSGINVSGSDVVLSDITSSLKKNGIKIFDKQSSKNISTSFDIVVIAGQAIKNDNPELKEAIKKNIKIIERSDALKMLTENKKLIAVTGSHGKTTVSSMITQSFIDNGIDISYVIGAPLIKYNSSAHLGKSEIMVIEADESDASFLKYKPYISVITNIEPDHLDFYKSIDNYNKTFKKYIGLTTHKLIINSKDKDYIPAFPKFSVNFFDDSADYFKTNKLIASTVLKEFNISKVLFDGTKRRFEFKGEVNGINVYDDYAHHPSEIKAMIELAKKRFPNSNINVVFEPHLFSRTQNFASKFSDVLKSANNVALVDIYPAREKPIKNVTSELITTGKYFNNWDDAIKYIVNVSKNGDVIFTVGAGTITQMGPLILDALKKQ
jgi:UDP-N-acetylmuramate--alanine ligase